jgi:hypothetical protein
MTGASAMRVVRAGTVGALFATALCGCTMPKKLSSAVTTPSAPPADGVTLPIGVFVAPVDRHDTDVDGLYPSTAPQDRMCCWLAPNATVTAKKTSGGDAVILSVLVPPFAFFSEGQTVTVDVGTSRQTFASLAPGVHLLSLDLDPATRAFAGNVRIAIHAARTFVPAREGVNADTRELGIVLLGVTFTGSSAGEP